MPLLDLKTDLKSLKYGNDQPGGGSSGQPYVTTDINRVDTGFNRFRLTKFDDGLVRGGVVGAANASIVDTIRIGKFLKDFPKGPLFIVKQVGLQLSNPRLESKKLKTDNPTTGGGLLRNVGNFILNTANKIQNAVGPTRIYNLGINTLAQVPVNAFGGHLNRHGFLPVQDDQTKYLAVAQNNNNEQNNRLAGLRNRFGLGINYDLNRGNIQLRRREQRTLNVIANTFYGGDIFANSVYNDIQNSRIDDYIGGPQSVYGIGRTLILRTPEYTNDNLKIDKAKNRNYNAQHIPEVKISSSFDFGLSLFTTSNLASSSFNLINNINFNPNSSFLDYNINNSKFKIKEFPKTPVSGSLLIPLIKELGLKEFKITLPTLITPERQISGFGNGVGPDRQLETAIVKTSPKPPKIQIGDSIPSLSSNNKLIRRSIITSYNNNKDAFKYRTKSTIDNLTRTDKTENLDDKIIANATQISRIDSRLQPYIDSSNSSVEKSSIRDNTAIKYDTSIPSLRKYSQLIDAINKNSNITQNYFKTADITITRGSTNFQYIANSLQNIFKRTNDINVADDTMALIFTPLDPFTGNALNILKFLGYITDYTEDYNSTWNDVKYTGRAEKFYIFNEFKRTINVGFQIPCFNREELEAKHCLLSELSSTLAGKYENNLLGGIITRLKVGNYINNQPGIINNLNFSPIQDSSWDLDAELAFYLKVSFGFTVIHDYLPQYYKCGFIFKTPEPTPAPPPTPPPTPQPTPAPTPVPRTITPNPTGSRFPLGRVDLRASIDNTFVRPPIIPTRNFGGFRGSSFGGGAGAGGSF